MVASNNRNVLSNSTGGPSSKGFYWTKVRFQQSCVLFRCSRGELLPCFFPASQGHLHSLACAPHQSDLCLHLSPLTYSLGSTAGEATTMRSWSNTTKSSPCLPQLEKACAKQPRPSAAKNKQMKGKKGVGTKKITWRLIKCNWPTPP